MLLSSCPRRQSGPSRKSGKSRTKAGERQRGLGHHHQRQSTARAAHQGGRAPPPRPRHTHIGPSVLSPCEHAAGHLTAAPALSCLLLEAPEPRLGNQVTVGSLVIATLLRRLLANLQEAGRQAAVRFGHMWQQLESQGTVLRFRAGLDLRRVLPAGQARHAHMQAACLSSPRRLKESSSPAASGAQTKGHIPRCPTCCTACSNRGSMGCPWWRMIPLASTTNACGMPLTPAEQLVRAAYIHTWQRADSGRGMRSGDRGSGG